MNMNQKNLNSFLELGYFLEYSNHTIDLNRISIDKAKYNEFQEDELIQEGSKIWKNSVYNLFEHNKKTLVPLSGGLDSRAVLAELLEHTEANNIHTYTFGITGAIDYEVGKLIAKEIGTQHISINLDEYTYTIEELLDVSKRVNQQTLLFYHDPVWLLNENFSDYQIWKGFLGETLTGSHFPKSESSNIIDAKEKFVSANRLVKSIDLKKPNVSYDSLIDHDSNLDSSDLTLEEQLDLQNRQNKYISPHVMLKGFEYKLPFLNSEFINFFLSIDNSFRRDQILYKKILLFLYPELFSKPTATNSGLSLGASKAMILINKVFNKTKRMIGAKSFQRINYFDFSQRMKIDQQFFDLIRTNIYDLEKRKIIDWIDIVKLFKVHVDGVTDYSDALLVLVSLEIHLKNGKDI
jgi:hypothetical protein